jgi:hypothetical protein
MILTASSLEDCQWILSENDRVGIPSVLGLHSIYMHAKQAMQAGIFSQPARQPAGRQQMVNELHAKLSQRAKRPYHIRLFFSSTHGTIPFGVRFRFYIYFLFFISSC